MVRTRREANFLSHVPKSSIGNPSLQKGGVPAAPSGTPDVRLSAPGSFARKINFPVETPCFQIKQTELEGADALPHWLPLQKIANGAVGHCLGAKGINLLMSTLQNRLVDHG